MSESLQYVDFGNHGLKCLFADKEFSDVTFVIGGKRIKAHRIILAAQSSYFKKLLFENPCKEGDATEITIEEPLEAFELLMEVMYGFKVELQSFQEKGPVYHELLDLARKFELLDLEEKLMKYFISAITYGTVFELLNLAYLYKSKALKEEYHRFIQEMGSVIFKDESIAVFPLAIFKEVLTSSLLKENIWKHYAIKSWWNRNAENLTEPEKKDLIQLVDVTKLSNRQIVHILGQSGLYDAQYLMNIIAKRTANVKEETENLDRNRVSIAVGQIIGTTLYDIMFRSEMVESVPTLMLKLNSSAYSFTFRITQVESKLQVYVCNDLEEHWSYLGIKLEQKGYFVSRNRPFNFIKIKSSN